MRKKFNDIWDLEFHGPRVFLALKVEMLLVLKYSTVGLKCLQNYVLHFYHQVINLSHDFWEASSKPKQPVLSLVCKPRQAAHLIYLPVFGRILSTSKVSITSSKTRVDSIQVVL